MAASDEEWQEALGRFVILRNQRVHAAGLHEIAKDCRALAERLRDLAFEVAVDVGHSGSAHDVMPSRQIARLCSRLGRADRDTGLLRSLLLTAADPSLGVDQRVAHLLATGAAAFSVFRPAELFTVAVVFGRLSELVRSSVQVMSHASRAARASAKGGRPPQQEVLILLEWGERHSVGVRQLARRLVAAGIAPPDEAVWEERLKAARHRHRPQRKDR